MKPPKKKKSGDISDLFGESPDTTLTKGERGAPAALRAIEAHELQCRNEKDEAHEEWKKFYAKIVDEDPVSIERADRLHRDYFAALELWDDATKKLALFDKGVSAERREGEKIPVSEAREIFAQYELCILQAVESYVISISQQAAICESPEAFHIAHAEAIKTARDSAIKLARSEGVIPAWL